MAVNSERIDALERQGWKMRFTAEEPRLSEAVEMYREAGFDVLLEPLPGKCKGCTGEETNGTCNVCFDGYEDQYRVIFTRPMEKNDKSREDLF